MQLGRIIDAYGHVLEPPDLWEKNLPSKFKDRALGIARSEAGAECLVVDGKISDFTQGLGVASAFGKPGELAFSNEFSYMHAPPGAYDPHERIKQIDADGIDAAVLYPTLGLLWEGEVQRCGTRQRLLPCLQRMDCRFLQLLSRSFVWRGSYLADGC